MTSATALLLAVEILLLHYFWPVAGSLLGLSILAAVVLSCRRLLRWLRLLTLTSLPLVAFVGVLQFAIPVYLLEQPFVQAISASQLYSLRILVMLGLVLAISLTVPVTSLAGNLLQLPLPTSLQLALISTFNMSPTFRSRFQRVIEAQQVRGLDLKANLLVRIYRLPPLLLPVLLRALDEATVRALSLELRGLGLSRRITPFLTQVTSPRHRILRLALAIVVFLTLAAVVYRVHLP